MAEETTGGQGEAPKVEVKNAIAQLEAMLDEYMVKKAPFALPLGLKEFLATVAPYLIIIGVVLALPALLVAFGISTAFAPVAMMGGYGYGWGTSMMITLATTIVVLVLEVMAVQGLFKRTHAAWRLMFYVSLVQLVGGVLAMNLVGAIIGAIIGWYILFQMKDMYKN
jgi:hypothetical protein